MLIGVAGAKRSGKDTVGDILVEKAGFVRISFAAPLKETLSTLYAYVGLNEEEIAARLSGVLKDVPDERLMNLSPRHLMVTLGTEWARDSVHPDFWLFLAQMRIGLLRAQGHQKIVITDVRFPNEIALIRSLGGEVAVVRRTKVEPRMDWWSRLKRFLTGRSIHPSETLWTKSIFDLRITNDGTLAELESKVLAFLTD